MDTIWQSRYPLEGENCWRSAPHPWLWGLGRHWPRGRLSPRPRLTAAGDWSREGAELVGDGRLSLISSTGTSLWSESCQLWRWNGPPTWWSSKSPQRPPMLRWVNSQAQLFSNAALVTLLLTGLCGLWWNQWEETLICVSVLAPPCTSSSGAAACCNKISIYVPASYILYLSDFCRFLLCTCGWERRGEKGRGLEFILYGYT